MSKRPGRDIWVYADLRSERLFGFSLNVLAKARDLARLVCGRAVVVLMGSSVSPDKGAHASVTAGPSLNTAAESCVSHGADEVYIFDNKALVVPRADIYAGILADKVNERGPMLVMLALTEFGRELGARTARIINAGLIADCEDLWVEDETVVARCPSWGGGVMANITFSSEFSTGFATVQPHAFRAMEVRGEPGIIKRWGVDRVEIPEGVNLIWSSSEHRDKQGLEGADVVVVGGAGLSNMADFGLVRQLAAALGGEVGATRPPVMQHWVEEERLIGQTGKTVRPQLLFSIGTSGAVQYTAGIKGAKTIVAVNRDRNAPIFHMADLGIVGDAKTFLPLLIARVKQKAMRRLADVLYGKDGMDTAGGFGAKVRRLREGQGWSVEALADGTGQSPEFIERVENDEITPPVSFLLQFASALKVDPGTFLRREEKAVIRNLRVQAFIKRTQDYSYETLSQGAESVHLRAFLITIEPRQAHKPVAYKHEGEEFIFVMEGELILTLGGKIHQLKRGESIHFNSDTPHKLKNTSGETTRCVVALYTP